MTASTASTLDQFQAAPESRSTHGTTTSGYGTHFVADFHAAQFTPHFAQNSTGVHHARPFQPSHTMKEVNRMLKLFIAGQTYVMDKIDALRTNEEGQTMAEYGVVLAVITMGVVIALTALGTEITGALGRVTAKLKP